MKKTFLSVILLLLAMAAEAQREFIWRSHEKVSSTEITPDSSPEDVVAFYLKSIDRNCTLSSGMSLVASGQKVDAYGNIHARYDMQNSKGQKTDYQLYMHFHPDGTLYYMNGVMYLLELDSQAKRMSARNTIPADRASLIATGKTTSEVVQTIVTYNDEPRHVYKVKDAGSLQDVYVDVYSGEVLYTIQYARSFSSWADLHGTNATLLANTMYSGMQQMDVMQTADGYILRDPVRNIVTVNATDKYKDLPQRDFPDVIGQTIMLATGSDDFVFNEQQLQTAQYATAVRSIYLNYKPEDPAEEIPFTTSIHAYYSDKDKNSLGDILYIDNVTWTKSTSGEYECMVNFPEPVCIDLLHTHHTVVIKIGDKEYVGTDIIAAGDDLLYRFWATDGSYSSLIYKIDVATDAMQPALDIHWGLQKTYDMYDTYFGIKGSDGEGSQLINIVNPSNNIPFMHEYGAPINAFALIGPLEDPYNNKSFYMFYGMGGIRGGEKPIVDLQTIAHEFTHTVTTGCGSDMLYRNESGALDEASADCMAMVVEDFALGQPSWDFGDKTAIFRANLRSYKDPWYSGSVDGKISERYAQPKYYGGRYWIDYRVNSSDNGGVHINSGVFNHLFYLLCEGAQNITNEVGQTHTIEAIGMDAMKDILFHSMVYYNSVQCSYTEIADNLMIAVEDIAQQDESRIAKQQEQMHIAYQHVGMTTSFPPAGITTVASDAHSPYSGTYNLYGIPVDDSYRGVVIRNGKKVLVK